MLAASARFLRFDLPLNHVAATRFLPWTLGVLVYLSVVALGLAAVAGRALETYAGRAKLVTVSLPSIEDAREREGRIATALDLLNGIRGVTSARPVPIGELEQLVEPWLGDANASVDLPLPLLIDVTLDPTVRIDLEALQEKLRAAVAGATVGVETVSRDRGERMAGVVHAWGSAAGVALLVSVLAAVVLITRTSMKEQVSAIELLRSMGASDAYLARQFERHGVLSALGGGLIGYALALATLLALLYSSSRAGVADTIELDLMPADWALLACVPAITVLLVMAAARMTATHGLRAMP